MTVAAWVLVGLLALVTALLLMAASSASSWYGRAQQYKKYWSEEVERAREYESECLTLTRRYKRLQKEYDELAELDEGEDYVRESLGYPPDEDDKESA